MYAPTSRSGPVKSIASGPAPGREHLPAQAGKLASGDGDKESRGVVKAGGLGGLKIATVQRQRTTKLHLQGPGARLSAPPAAGPPLGPPASAPQRSNAGSPKRGPCVGQGHAGISAKGAPPRSSSCPDAALSHICSSRAGQYLTRTPDLHIITRLDAGALNRIQWSPSRLQTSTRSARTLRAQAT